MEDGDDVSKRSGENGTTNVRSVQETIPTNPDAHGQVEERTTAQSAAAAVPFDRSQ
jgi:hypothetical protein